MDDEDKLGIVLVILLVAFFAGAFIAKTSTESKICNQLGDYEVVKINDNIFCIDKAESNFKLFEITLTQVYTQTGGN